MPDFYEKMRKLKLLVIFCSFSFFACTKCLECTYQLGNGMPTEKIKKCARKEELEALQIAINQEYPTKNCKYVSK